MSYVKRVLGPKGSLMKFGTSLPGNLIMPDPRRVDAALVGDLARRIEELDFDFITAADHVFVPTYWKPVIGSSFLDPFACLMYCGAHTSRIRLFLACLVMPYRQPITTAKTIATIDQLTNGRLILGVVPGYLKEEFEAFNLPLEERGAMTDEFTQMMRELWSNDPAQFEGKYYSAKDVSVWPTCQQEPHVPIWFGGSSRQSIRRAVELGSGWAPLAFDVTPEPYLSAHSDELRGKALPTSGTTPERLRQGLSYAGQVADDLGRELELEVVVYPGRPTLADNDSTTPHLGRRERVEDDQLIEWLKAFVDAGATAFSVNVAAGSEAEYREAIEHFATNIAPVVREL